MNVTPTYTPDNLRSACLDYIIANAEPDIRGVTNAETPGGLTIENGPGWLTITGVWIDFVHQEPAGTEVSDSVTYNYGDPNSPHVERIEWPTEGAPRVTTIRRAEHNRIATGLMMLLDEPKIVAVAS